MTATMSTRAWAWPRTLGSRLFVILLAGLVVAYALSFAVLFSERYMSAREVMLGTLETDVSTAIAILDRLPADERPQWLPRLNRGNYQYILGPGLPGVPEMTQRGKDIAARISEASGGRFPVTVESIPGDGKQLQAHLTLSDGSTLTIDVHPRMTPIAQWLPYVLVVQLLLLIVCCWFAVRYCGWDLAEAAYGSCLPGGSAGEVVGDTVTPGEAEVTGAGACVAVGVPCARVGVPCDASGAVDGLVDEAFASRRLRSSSVT